MSFGVSADDLAPVGMALNSHGGYRCAPATTVIPAQGAQLQSICQADECPIVPNSTCDGVPESVEPATATMSGTAGMPTSTTPVVVGNGASAVSMSLLAIFGGLAALLVRSCQVTGDRVFNKTERKVVELEVVLGLVRSSKHQYQ